MVRLPQGLACRSAPGLLESCLCSSAYWQRLDVWGLKLHSALQAIES